jgi:hypothetical protein
MGRVSRPPARWTLHRGDAAPVQQSPTTCGSASLAVARMLNDPAFADWVLWGGDRDVAETDPAGMSRRFAAYERGVMSRTNALLSPAAGLTLPWPRALGTPPWGARAELERVVGRSHGPYAVRLVRFGSPATLLAAYRGLVSSVAQGAPALLYVGDEWLPRHVTLVLPGEGDGAESLYDPATGTVARLDPDAFAGRRLGVAGWDVPWFLVCPRR